MTVTYTISQWQADVLASTWVSGSTIEDSSTNISAPGVLDSLQSAYTTLGPIIISDNGPLTVSIAQINNDANALALVVNANSTAYTLTVSDTGLDITNNLNALESNTHVTSIVISDSGSGGIVEVAVSQIASDATALSFLTTAGDTPASITVYDSASSIQHGWANIAADSQVSSIIIADNNQITLNVTQANDTATVAQLHYSGGSPATGAVIVKDTGAHIFSNLGTLQSEVSYIGEILVTNNTFNTLSAAQVANDATALSKVQFASGTPSFTVSDTAAQISLHLDPLQANADIASITVTTVAPITASIEQLTNDSDALSIMTYTGGGAISVAIVDTGNNISANLAVLEAAIQEANPTIASIAVTGSEPINVTIHQLNVDSSVFSALAAGGSSYELDVSDTSGNISGAIDTLGALASSGNIASIMVTNSGPIQVTVGQITTDAVALGELVNNDTNPYTLAVSDSASNVGADLLGLGTNTHVASITLTDPTLVLSITGAQFVGTGGTTALGEITNSSFTIDVTSVGATQAATVASDFAGLSNKSHATLSIGVSDTASAISGALDTLNSNGYVASINIASGGALMLTEAQFAGGLTALGEITNSSFTVDVSGVSLTQLPTVTSDFTGLLNAGNGTLQVGISDTASAISGALDSLNTNGYVTSINIASGGALTLTESQFVGGLTALGEITNGSFTIDVSGVSLLQLPTVTSDFTGLSNASYGTLSVGISDTASAISAALDSLNTNGYVTSINIASGGALTLTEAQFVGGLTALGEITNSSFTIDVSGVSLAQLSTVTNDFTSLPNAGHTALRTMRPDLSANHATLQVGISDTASAISGALDSLSSNSYVTSITITGGGPLIVTEAQFVGGLAALAEITNGDTLVVSSVTLAQLPTVTSDFTGLPNANHFTLQVGINDSASAISGALDSLSTNSYVNAIAITSGSTLTLTEAQFVGGLTALREITNGAFTIDVSGVTLAQLSTVTSDFTGLSNANHATLSVAISDSAQNIAGAVSALNTNAYVTSVTVSDNATNVATYLDTLNGVSHLSITLTGTPTLTLTEAQFVGGLTALGAITNNPFTIDVTSGVTVAKLATVTSDFTGLSNSANATLSIAVSDNVSNVAAGASALNANTHVTSVAASGGAASVDANLDTLNSISHLSITVTGTPTLTLTEAQYVGGLTALGEITNTSFTIDVTGVSVAQLSAVTTDFTNLPNKIHATLSIAVVDSAANVSANASTLNANTYITSVAVFAPAAGVQLYLDALNSVNHLAITISGTPTLTLSESTYVAGLAALGAITNASFTVDVTGVSLAQLSTVTSDFTSLANTAHGTLQVGISDTASAISGALDSLNTNGYVTSINIASGGALTLTEAQFVGGLTALDEITNSSFTVDVSNVGATQAATVASDFTGLANASHGSLSIAVSDTATAISGALDNLATNTYVSSINITTGGALSVSATSFLADQTALGLITNSSFAIDVTSASATQAATIQTDFGNLANVTADNTAQAGSVTLSIAVVDGGGAISTNLDNLNSNPYVTSIDINDTSPISVSESVFVGGLTALGEITNSSFAIDVTGVGAAQAATVATDFGNLANVTADNIAAAGSVTLSITVSDTASNIAGAFDALNGNTAISKIIVNNSGAGQYPTITAEQGANDTFALSHLYKADGTTPYQAVVYDTGTAFLSNLPGLESNSAYFLNVQLSTSSTLTITDAQFESNQAILDKIQYWSGRFDVTGVTTADFASVAGYTYTNTSHGISLSDTAAHIASDLGTLESDSGYINTITLTDLTPPTIMLNYSQYVAALSVLGSIASGTDFTLAVTGVSIGNLPTVASDFTGLTDAGSATLQVGVSDLGSAISSALDSLNTNGYVTSIHIGDGAPILLSATTFLGGLTALGEITNSSFAIDVMNASATQAATIATDFGNLANVTADNTAVAGSVTLSISVADGGSAISTYLDNLSNNPYVTHIDINDSNPISVSATTFLGGLTALDEITNATFAIEVTAASATQAGTVATDFKNLANVTADNTAEAGSVGLQISVADGGAAISANLDNLSNNIYVNHIDINDSAPISVSATTFLGGLSALSVISNASFAVDVTSASATQAASVATDFGGLYSANFDNLVQPGSATLSIAVVDGGTAISNNLDNLSSNPYVTSIHINDSAPISVSGTSFLTDQTALGLITNSSFAIDVTTATATQAATIATDFGNLANVTADNTAHAGSVTLSIAVVDGGGAISTNLDNLNGNPYVTSIDINDSAPISVSATAYVGGLTALSEITNASFTIDVSATAAQALTVDNDFFSLSNMSHATLSIAVTDTAQNIAGAVSALNTNPYVTSVTVSDNAADIATYLATLGGVRNLSIALTGTPTLTLTEAQFVGDLAALGAISNGSFTIAVTGVTVAKLSTVTSDFTGLSNSGHATLSIAVSDNVSNVAAGASALSASPYVTSVAASGGAASVDANLDTLNGISHLSITVTGTPTLTLTEAQYVGGLTALGAITNGSFTIDVTGVSVAQLSAVTSDYLALPNKSSATLSIAVVDSATNVATNASTLNANPYVTSVAVFAPAAGVQNNLDALNSVHHLAITISGTPTLTLSESTYVAGLAALGAITNASFTIGVTGVSLAQLSTVTSDFTSLANTAHGTLQVGISDTASAISGALDSLNTNGYVTSINIASGGALTLTESQFVGGLTALGEITNSFTVDVSNVGATQAATVASDFTGLSTASHGSLTIAVSDTATAISGALDTLNSDTYVTSINIASGGALMLTEAQFVGGLTALGKITNSSFTIDVSGVSLAQLPTVTNDFTSLPNAGHTGLGSATPDVQPSHGATLQVGISDTASAISGALDSLSTNGYVTSINIASGGALSVSESVFVGGLTALGEITNGSFTVDVTNVGATQAATVATDFTNLGNAGDGTLSIAVSDTASAISGALDTLNSNGYVSTINIASGGALMLTEAQYVGGLTALGEITNSSFTIAVSGVGLAQLSTVTSDFTHLSNAAHATLQVGISDTASAISGALDSLNSNGYVTSISIASGGALTLTEAQFAGGLTALGEISNGSFTIDVSGATAAQAAVVNTDFTNLPDAANASLSISVSDTAAHVSGHAAALNLNSYVTSVTVTDTAADVTTVLDTLNGVAALTAINLIDTTPVLALTDSQFVGGLAALGVIQNATFAIDITSATAAQAATAASDFTGISFVGTPTLSIAVADNATNVATDVTALNGNPYVTSIAITDSAAHLDTYLDSLDGLTAPTTITLTNATPVLSLTAAQFEGGTAALGDITNSAFTIDVTTATSAQATAIANEFVDLGNHSHAALSIAVSDSALFISNTFTVLEANEYVTSLTINDSNPLNIDYAQFNAGTTLLSELTGTATVNVTGVTGQNYDSFTDTYINGTLAETVQNDNDNSLNVIGYASNLTFAPAGPSAQVETITVTGAKGDAFVFSGSFGNVTVTGFNLAHDTIQFSNADFANVAAVEAHATQLSGNTVVTLDSGDTITFTGVTLSQFEAHSADWSFFTPT